MPGRWCGRGGGFNAGQVARPGGSDAGQVRRNFRQWSHRTTGFFFHSCRLRRQPQHFFPEKIPTLARASMPGRSVARSVSEPRWASHQTRLGEPVLRVVGRARTQWGEPVLIGRAIKRGWASHSTTFTVANANAAWRCACSAHLQVPARHVYLSACSARLLKCLLLCLFGTVPARHCASSAPGCLCLLGTFS